MKIDEIEGKAVKINKNSITVLNTVTFKTQGIVTGATRFQDLQANKQINFSKLLRSTGIWGNPQRLIEHTFIIDNKVYQLRNINTYKASENDFYTNLENNGIKVLNIILYK